MIKMLFCECQHVGPVLIEYEEKNAKGICFVFILSGLNVEVKKQKPESL